MKRFGVLLLIIVVALVLLILPNYTGKVVTVVGETAIVSRVVDGDTIVLVGGDRVRLLGINTPEQGQHLYLEAGQRLEELVLDETVLLESDVTDKDKYDRQLRYVYIDGDDGYENVNVRMVGEGFASVYIIEPDHRHVEELMTAEEFAREQGLGVWQYYEIEDVFCVGLHYPFRYNAKGDDRQNLNGEYLILRNSCTYPVELSGWRLADNTSKEYIFKSFTLMNKTIVTLHTGSGQDNETDLYWGQSWPVWNNNGDILYLWDSEGNLILRHAY